MCSYFYAYIARNSQHSILFCVAFWNNSSNQSSPTVRQLKKLRYDLSCVTQNENYYRQLSWWKFECFINYFSYTKSAFFKIQISEIISIFQITMFGTIYFNLQMVIESMSIVKFNFSFVNDRKQICWIFEKETLMTLTTLNKLWNCRSFNNSTNG